jgi:hypothetical protein
MFFLDTQHFEVVLKKSIECRNFRTAKTFSVYDAN